MANDDQTGTQAAVEHEDDSPAPGDLRAHLQALAKEGLGGRDINRAMAEVAVREALKGDRHFYDMVTSAIAPETPPDDTIPPHLALLDPAQHEGAAKESDIPRLRDLRRNQRKFIVAYVEAGTIRGACKAARVSRSAVRLWRRDDPTFKEAFDAAEELVTEDLQDEAKRRARDGVLEPVYYKGMLIDHVRKPSDRLLVFLLSHLEPRTFNRAKIKPDGEDTDTIHVKRLIVDGLPQDPRENPNADPTLEAVEGGAEGTGTEVPGPSGDGHD